MVACIFCNKVIRTLDGSICCSSGKKINSKNCEDFIIRTKNLINLNR